MNYIRNFCIIAHIDHGKSTLADRMLEITGTVEKRLMKEQILDQMDLERERGMTIKLQPVRMLYRDHILNLIDTPGHVDFSYEVSRSLAAVEGALLLVDATQGIQAQTLSTLYQAIEENLTIIPVINKIDLLAANPKQVVTDLEKLLSCSDSDILLTSGKTGQGVEELLDKIIEKIPPPAGKINHAVRILVFDSKYDPYRGVIVYGRVFDGRITTKDKIKMVQSGNQDKIIELGYFIPNMKRCDYLQCGDIGYIITGFKDISQIHVGETITKYDQNVQPLPGYKKIQPNVYSSLFATNNNQYSQLRNALEKLKLNDAALVFEAEYSSALGFGFRCGFLGLLHLEIIKERLTREFDLELITTIPSVAYQVNLANGQKQIVYSAEDLPDANQITSALEPIADVEIISWQKDFSSILKLITLSRGKMKNTNYLKDNRLIISATIPLAEIIVNFFDQLKSITAGYSSMSYEIKDFEESDLIRLEILVAGEKIKPLSTIVTKEQIQTKGRLIVEKLKNLLPRHNFAIPIQAMVGGKIIARETLPAYRKDVTEKLYGGDITRKTKLLEKQKKGKKRQAKFGKVVIPPDVFLKLLKKP